MAKEEVVQCRASVKTFICKPGPVLNVEMIVGKVRLDMQETQAQQANSQQ